MSDINDLIHTNSRLAFEQGVKTERERIITQLTQYVTDLRECGKKDNCLDIAIAVEGQIEDIKGERD